MIYLTWFYMGQDGSTALHLAGKSGHENIVRLLLARGAEIESKNDVTSTL